MICYGHLHISLHHAEDLPFILAAEKQPTGSCLSMLPYNMMVRRFRQPLPQPIGEMLQLIVRSNELLQSLQGDELHIQAQLYATGPKASIKIVCTAT